MTTVPHDLECVCSDCSVLFCRRKREREGEGMEVLEGGLDVSVILQIDKDVVRTDRSHPYYRGEGNRHVGTLK